MRKYFFRGKRKDNGEWVIGKGIDTNKGKSNQSMEQEAKQ